jgi:hypothetical protein
MSNEPRIDRSALVATMIVAAIAAKQFPLSGDPKDIGEDLGKAFGALYAAVRAAELGSP